MFKYMDAFFLASVEEPGKPQQFHWNGSPTQKRWQDHGLCFVTKEEAIRQGTWLVTSAKTMHTLMLDTPSFDSADS